MSILCLAPPSPQQQGCSGIYSALCTKLHATQPLARDVSTLLEGEGGFMMIALEGLCFTASYLGLLSAPPCLSQLPQRPKVSQDMALSRALVPGDMHPAPMFFHLSPSKFSWVPPGPPGPIRVPPGHDTLNVSPTWPRLAKVVRSDFIGSGLHTLWTIVHATVLVKEFPFCLVHSMRYTPPRKHCITQTGCGVKPTGTGTRRDPHVHFA